MRKVGIALTLTFGLAAPALSSQQSGKITLVALGATPPAVFILDGARSSIPACATDSAWVIPPTADSTGQQLLSGILTAFAAGKTVSVVGSGTCSSLQANREQVDYITIVP